MYLLQSVRCDTREPEEWAGVGQATGGERARNHSEGAVCQSLLWCGWHNLPPQSCGHTCNDIYQYQVLWKWQNRFITLILILSINTKEKKCGVYILYICVCVCAYYNRNW